MRTVILAGVLTLFVPSVGRAAPIDCVAGGLDLYLALGAGGCALGPATVANFTAGVLPGTDPLDAIAASDVFVTPTPGIGLEFKLMKSVDAPDLLEILIGFTLAGPTLTDNTLSMTGSTATGDGNVTAVQDICVGGDFGGADPGEPCSTGLVESMIVAQIASGLDPPDSQSFVPASFFDVFLTLTIDGGNAPGAAALNGPVTTVFSVVPEPATVWLVAGGLAALCRRRFRSRT
jgi:hypothetical protein